MVADEHISSAVGINASAATACRILGPTIAGAIIVSYGASSSIALTILLTMSGIVFLNKVSISNNGMERPSGYIRFGSILQDATKHITHSRYQASLSLNLFLVTFLPLSFVVVLPSFAEERMTEVAYAYGILYSSFGAGSFIGSANVATRGQRGYQGLIMSVLVLSLLEALLPFQSSLSLSSVIMFFCGVCSSSFLTTVNSLMLLASPVGDRGRVGALYSYIVAGVGPLGSSGAALLVSAGGSSAALFAGSAVALVSALLLALGGQRRPDHGMEEQKGG